MYLVLLISEPFVFIYLQNLCLINEFKYFLEVKVSNKILFFTYKVRKVIIQRENESVQNFAHATWQHLRVFQKL